MTRASDADCHLLASGVSALFSFPLWRASAIAQSGFGAPAIAAESGLCSRLMPFSKSSANACALFVHAIKPPYTGVAYVLAGMTW
jgi:hypothetical protein